MKWVFVGDWGAGTGVLRVGKPRGSHLRLGRGALGTQQGRRRPVVGVAGRDSWSQGWAWLAAG